MEPATTQSPGVTPSASKHSLLDWLILSGGAIYFILIVSRAALHEPGALVVVPAIILGLAAMGSLAGWAALRFISRNRWTFLAANFGCYLLVGIVLGVAWDDEFFRILPKLAAGPLAFLSDQSAVQVGFSFISGAWAMIFVIGALVIPMLLMMLASVFRPNKIGKALTAFGVALWYLTGFGALLGGIG